MADQISIRLDESVVNAGSAVTATVNFRTRATAAASTPSAIRYRVDCLTTKRALVEWTSVSAASSVTITIPGTSNAIVSESDETEKRQLTVEIDTDLDTQARAATTWTVRNIRNFPTFTAFPPGLQLEPFYAEADVESGLTIEHYQYPVGHRFRYLDTFDVVDAHYYRQTAAELAAGVTPTNYGYEPGDVRRYGAVGDGSTDDTTAISNALLANEHVIVPANFTPLITSSITIPNHTKLEFRGGPGNTDGQFPSSYFIKDAAMTTAGIILKECSMIQGGGLICEDGNTGNGIQIYNNSAKVRHFLVHNAGDDGVRVGRDGLTNSGNYNSFELTHVVSQYNGGNGFLIHDGKTDPENAANANAGTLTQCFSHHNGGDGFELGFAWWNTLVNCLAEVNTGYGLNLSGENKDDIPACRWTTVLGGDYNEQNTAGIINDPAYFSTFIMPDANQYPSTAANGLEGSAFRTVIGGSDAYFRGAVIYGRALDVQTGQIKFPTSPVASSDATTLDQYKEGADDAWTPAQSGVTLTVGEARYCKIGRMVWVFFDVTWPSTADTTLVTITGLPFTPISDNAGSITIGYTTYATLLNAVVGATGILILGEGGNPADQLDNADLSTERIAGSGWYMAST